MKKLPTFQLAFLHPRYWLLWLGIAALYIITLLPYRLIYSCGKALGWLAEKLLTRRVKIADRNLQLCFPNMPAELRQQWIKTNFFSVGMGVLETGMAWFWPNWRIKKIFKIIGYENMQRAHCAGRGVIVLGMHFLTLELGARIFGLLNPGIGVYRPNNNPLYDWLQTRGRIRSNKTMLDRFDIKGMIQVLKQGEILWYAPDHDYGPKSSIFVPFFAVEHAATTTGTYMLLKGSHPTPAMIPFIPRRLANGQGYELVILPEATIDITDKYHCTSQMNQVIEQCILQAPEQYMWLHRRFKTRPAGEDSLY